ncbi:MAG TPA: hypothetical protein EYP85_06365 [Armatimonadetes bacterium]|nr:hypothetical protein [Armatimonadota bacterium]
MEQRRHPFTQPPRRERDLGACGLCGFLNRDGRRVSGEVIVRGIANMHDRGNGLGGGFAAYGIYPDYRDFYALHIMYDRPDLTKETEEYLRRNLEIAQSEEIKLFDHPRVSDHPYFKRYFVQPPDTDRGRSPDDYIVQTVMHINVHCGGAFVVSSGKNMGAFKGVGYAEDLAEFFCLDEYEGYLWTAHNRFPTNTPGWWGGAHPFTLLDWSIVHNGEISSYGINKRYLEMFGYHCTLLTDTEVVAYLLDLLVRRHGLSFEQACLVLAPPFWKDIDRLGSPQREEYTHLRMIYGSAALNGPFAFLFGFTGGLIGLNDRVKLRPLVVGENGSTFYLASEEAAIRALCPEVKIVWAPVAGEPVIVRLEEDSSKKNHDRH